MQNFKHETQYKNMQRNNEHLKRKTENNKLKTQQITTNHFTPL